MCKFHELVLFNLLFTTKHLHSLLWIIQFSCYILYSNEAKAQLNETISLKQTAISDTLQFPKDSTKQIPDTLKQVTTDTFRISKDAITDIIDYQAQDSSLFDLKQKKAYFYGNASIKYEGIDLKAALIIVDFDKRELYAIGRIDSAGRYVGKPIFNDGERETEADTMIYNFNTKRGRTYGITMKEGDGFIHCNKVLRDDDQSLYSDVGKYTTCNNPEHPHFYLKAQKLKIIPNKKIIFGPANLVIEDVPTPLFIPFGMFPTKKEKRSGLVPFDYGMSGNFGPFLRNIGYHFAISDKIDQSIMGDIYFRGSWRIASNTRYNKRYKYNGNFQIENAKYLTAEREDPLYKLKNTKTFSLRWTHSQDPKANPGSTFTANVNIQKNNAAQLNSVNPTTIVTNEFGSSVSYSKMLFRNKVNFVSGITHRQNTQNRNFSMSLPNITLNVQRITPFSKPNAIGKYKWYKDFGVSYQLQFENRIETKDSIFFSGLPFESILPGVQFNSPLKLTVGDEFKQGIIHSIPITLGSYKFFKQKFSFTPTVNYREFWYFNSIEKNWNEVSKKIDTTFNRGFSRASDYSANANIGTQIFGTYQFRSKKLSAIRHTITPNIGFSYRPDYSQEKFGIFKQVQADTSGRLQRYSKYENAILGSPSGGASGLLNFSIGNNLQAKVLKKTDSSAKFENKTWIESFNISGNYNFLDTAKRLSNISVSGFTKLFNHVNLNANAILNPYQKVGNETIDKLEILRGKRIGTWTSGQVSMQTGINADMFKSKKSLDTTGKIKTQEDVNEFGELMRNPDAYVNFDREWSLNVNYSMNYTRINYATRYFHTLGFSGDLNLTPKWKIGCNSGYDFEQKKIAFTQFEVSRLLHCWALNFSWIPDGVRKSFFFSIKVNSSILQSLKVDKKRLWTDR